MAAVRMVIKTERRCVRTFVKRLRHAWAAYMARRERARAVAELEQIYAMQAYIDSREPYLVRVIEQHDQRGAK
ncbi:MAG: hypothetical protein V4621_07430 [Pseudomonadota bacterium]